ncbi:hypothetical protein LO772_26470 [Yinghuangia sp. ASG 101]|uniref:hypothetical protein n=1 Tax=Yinghuangia sp. ASG 101 TaxID=2896848 RepID=UPI001E5C07C4|nr:hypothetical protein [Yinghuangia sp. ASG 101]UGQ10379.1 hypothetical protein LO772_26470 [Yinghuangia sp. ASG 101]
MLIGLIIACEVAFWVVLGLALTARYIFRLRRTSTALLVAVPLVDVVLLVATVIDLRDGATAGFRHGLSAAYIGFSVAYGHYLVRWADVRFAHRFAGGPPPVKPPKYGAARAAHEWRIAGMTAVAGGIAAGLLQAAILGVDDASRTGQLSAWQGRMGVIVGINALIALTYTLWPKKPSADTGARRDPRVEKYLNTRG